MEKKVKEETGSKRNKMIIPTPDWLDLPEPIATNIILEHLEILDYILFSVVCKKWQSIQEEHRTRYSPYPPPLPFSFPWFTCKCDKQKSICFYVPDKGKSYEIPLPRTRINPCVYTMVLGHGFLLLLYDTKGFHHSMPIFNPITRVQIELPIYFYGEVSTAYISPPPTDPDCTIVIRDSQDTFYLYRLNDKEGLKKIEYSERDVGEIVFCRNKMYNVMMSEIGVVDTLLPNPVEQMIEMDCSDIYTPLLSTPFYAVDFLGDLVVVIFTVNIYYIMKRVYVYRADFSRNKWMRVKSLGDHALFFSEESIFSLPAVDYGYRKNTIYSTMDIKNRDIAWKAFDLSTGNWFDGPLLSLPNKYSKRSWFLPTLHYIDDAKINGASSPECSSELE